MSQILLLEPSYKNKYPPLSLMKIATYHREKGDIVRFAKGELQPADSLKYDRVYVSTLFTFEWEKTKKAIIYALKLVVNPSNVYVGGILATLKPNWIEDAFPDIHIVTGLLNERGKLGYDDDEQIDTLPPDYSILDEVKEQHEYRTNAFFAYTTRGCGMNCSFCAVKDLEPKYIPRIPIKDQIEAIKEKYGNSRDLRNLLLMDNNVLKSPYLREIVDEIKELGFAKGASYTNPLTQKKVQRVVDFNQGLDANFLTQDKANMLGELELKPARIAFDHIFDKDNYITAIERCVRAGLRYFSNYLLFNSDKGPSFKGHAYPPDTPEDLYNRLVLNMKLQERLNLESTPEDKVSIYSFPMRYAPLELQHRKFIGPNWNAKYLRAIQVMLTPTQGKGVSNRNFFNASFGTDLDEYKMNLVMPEYILAARGKFVDKTEETSADNEVRRKNWDLKRELQKEWILLYQALSNRDDFINKIANNHFDLETYRNIDSPAHKHFFLYYLHDLRLLSFLNQVSDEELSDIGMFLNQDNQIISILLRQYIEIHKPSYEYLRGYLKIMGHHQIQGVLKFLATPAYILSGKCAWAADINLPSEQIIATLGRAWGELYDSMTNQDKYLELISSGITLNTFNSLRQPLHKKTFLYHYSVTQILDLIGTIDSESDLIMIHNYFIKEAPFWLDYLAHYLYFKQSPYQTRLTLYVKLFGKHGVNRLLKLWFEDPQQSIHWLDKLQKVFLSLKVSHTDIDTLSALREYVDLGVFSNKEFLSFYESAINNNFDVIRNAMITRFGTFSEKFLSQIPSDITGKPLRRAAEEHLDKFYQRFFL